MPFDDSRPLDKSYGPYLDTWPLLIYFLKEKNIKTQKRKNAETLCRPTATARTAVEVGDFNVCIDLNTLV